MMIRGLENLTQEERLRNLGLFCLRKVSFIGGGSNLITALQHRKGSYRRDEDTVFTRICDDRTREGRHKVC